MPATEDFITGLQANTGNETFPLKFWVNYSKENKYTFTEALDKYAEYYHALQDSSQKQALAKIFWQQLKSIGTPIIEDISQDKCRIYFLFPKDEIKESKENSGTKKDVYLQGDIHGYDVTTGKQMLNEFKGTGIMIHTDEAVPRDAIVNYRFIQLEPSLRNKQPRPDLPPFFSNKPTVALPDYGTTGPPTLEESQIFWSPESQCVDENSAHSESLPGNQERVFRVNSDPKLSYISVRAVEWSKLFACDQSKPFMYHATYLSDLNGNLTQDELPISDQYMAQFFYTGNESPLSQFTRVIHLFKPASGKVDNIIVVNDGLQYLVIGIMAQFEKMVKEGQLSPHTALVFVTTMTGLEKTLKSHDSKALMQGMGFGRTIDYEHGIKQYADFIGTTLFQQLKREGMLPPDATNRLILGSSLSGTASLFLAFNHPELFGSAIVQSPSSANRHILNDIVAHSENANSSEKPMIYLSCGIFEDPKYATANAFFQYASELADKLHVEIHPGLHGHYFLAWVQSLEQSLPALTKVSHPLDRQKTKKSENTSTRSQSFFSQLQESATSDKQEQKTLLYRKKGG